MIHATWKITYLAHSLIWKMVMQTTWKINLCKWKSNKCVGRHHKSKTIGNRDVMCAAKSKIKIKVWASKMKRSRATEKEDVKIGEMHVLVNWRVICAVENLQSNCFRFCLLIKWNWSNGNSNDDSLSFKCSFNWKISRFNENSNGFYRFFFFFYRTESQTEATNLSVHLKTWKSVGIENRAVNEESLLAWANVICTFCIYIRFALSGKILSHRTHTSTVQFYNIEHMSYYVFICAPRTHTRLFTIRIASSISTNYNKLAKYSPNTLSFLSAIPPSHSFQKIAKTLYVFVQL